MRYVAMFLMLLSLCVFSIGCQPADQGDSGGDAAPAEGGDGTETGEMVEEDVEVDLPAGDEGEPAPEEPTEN